MLQPSRILITDRFDVEAFAHLKGEASLDVHRSETPKPTAEELAPAEVLVIRSRTRIDATLLEQSPKLRAIITATSGFDHIDLAATAKRDVTVMYTPDANEASACELTWALVLACARRIPEAHRAVKSGEWKREALVGRELAGKTYGVIGLGRIGTRVARIAQAFGMRVMAFDPYQEDSYFAKENIARISLDELLKLSDVVSVHVPATSETHHLITRNYFEFERKDLIFVNTSRGTVIEEALLVEALEKQWIAACGLDVFEREPLPQKSHLMNFPNVVMSPHIGATTTEAFKAASMDAAQKALAFVRSSATSDLLPPQATWAKGGFRRSSGDA